MAGLRNNCRRLRSSYSSKYWSPDVVSLVLAAAVIITMAVILHAYNRRPFTDWSAPITLNATISILVTIMYMLLTSPVSSCLGQLKWNYFTDGRRLFDFQSYDHAAKGVLGSLLLIIRRPRDLLALSAALLTLSVTAVGPFVQQIIGNSYADRRLAIPSFLDLTRPLPSVPVARYWFPHDLSLSDANIDPGLEYAVYSGVLTNKPTSYNITSNCLNTNCTWQSYTSLAVQSQCVDLSSSLTTQSSRSGQKGNGAQILSVTLPNQHALYIPDLGPNANGGAVMNVTSVAPSTNFGSLGNVLVDFTVIYAKYDTMNTSDGENQWFTFNQSAFECVLQFVSQPFTANFSNSFLNETLAGPATANNSDWAVTYSPWTIARSLLAGNRTSLCPDKQPPCSDNSTINPDMTIDYPNVDNNNASSPSQPAIYTGVQAGLFLSEFLMSRVFNGTVDYKLRQNLDPAAGALNYRSPALASPALSALFYPYITNGKRVYDPFTLDQLMANVAGSITKYLRDGQPLAANQQQFYAVGARTAWIIVYDIAWPWIALPAALLLAVAGLVAATAIHTKRSAVPVWGTSSLATMMHGPPGEVGDMLRTNITREELERAAKKVRMRFDRRAGRLVGEKGNDLEE